MKWLLKTMGDLILLTLMLVAFMGCFWFVFDYLPRLLSALVP